MRLAFPSLLFTAVVLLTGAAGVNAAPQHSLTVYVEPAKYPQVFIHFSYVNPLAPNSATFLLSSIVICHFSHVLPSFHTLIFFTQISVFLFSPLSLLSLFYPFFFF